MPKPKSVYSLATYMSKRVINVITLKLKRFESAEMWSLKNRLLGIYLELA